MKPQPKSLKLIALLLSVAILVQGCAAYNGLPTPIDKAVPTSNKVKVVLSNNRPYIFKRIDTDGSQLYGIVKQKSDLAQQLPDQIIPLEDSNRFVRINLEIQQIKEVYLLNKEQTTFQNIALVLLVGVPIVIGIIVAAGGDIGCCY